MIIGIPKELKVGEKRVAITPAGVRALAKHVILIETGAGLALGWKEVMKSEITARHRGWKKSPEEFFQLRIERRYSVWPRV